MSDDRRKAAGIKRKILSLLLALDLGNARLDRVPGLGRRATPSILVASLSLFLQDAVFRTVNLANSPSHKQKSWRPCHHHAQEKCLIDAHFDLIKPPVRILQRDSVGLSYSKSAALACLVHCSRN